MFSGSFPALVTLFCDGSIDEAGYKAFVDWQV
ncbi:MAG TPA: 4-hydroxy-tetrahydrodipicolinate synthase, partial [Sphingomonas sp.]|nr:4-hydroxy-tetrahydrodipicolinate synthase [Sphingomonas sp.]